jgi:hypothetical protein
LSNNKVNHRGAKGIKCLARRPGIDFQIHYLDV